MTHPVHFDEPPSCQHHTVGDAGDFGDAGDVLRFFLGDLGIFHSRTGRELSDEPKLVKIARFNFENNSGPSFVTFFSLRQSSWAGAIAPARFAAAFFRSDTN